MIRVFFHSNCNDGLAAAAVAFKVFGDNATYVPVAYGQPMPDYEVGDDIYILDFSYKRSEIEAMNANVTVLDHHKTAEKELGGVFEPKTSSNLTAFPYIYTREIIFDLSQSGAGLAWRYWFPNEPEPELVQLTRDRDLWKFELGDRTNQLHNYLLLTIREPRVWAVYLSGLPGDCFQVGEFLEVAKLRQVEDALKNARGMIIDGYAVPVVNSSVHMSDIGHQLMEWKGMSADVLFTAVYFQQSDGRFKFSLRSNGFDVSAIAKQFGGGGHNNAAGFTLESLQDLNLDRLAATK